MNPQLTPGDALLIALQARVDKKPAETLLELRVNIVGRPVIPAPEAGYGLLSQHTSDGEACTECVRFAWVPEPSRVELVNPDDLTTDLVRRRAVFQWTDTVRFNRATRYAIQKITPFGSTHFPPLNGEDD